MPSNCCIRALWILNNQDTVVFSRRFPVVERRWSAAFKRENESLTDTEGHSSKYTSVLPTDSDLADAFVERRKREGSARGFGIRVTQSSEGSDSWVDDPITRHIISLHINKEEEGENSFLWPFILHIKGHYSILVLPLVEPSHVKTYARMSRRSDCGNAVGVDESLSSLLLDLPCITGYVVPVRGAGLLTVEGLAVDALSQISASSSC